MKKQTLLLPALLLVAVSAHAFPKDAMNAAAMEAAKKEGAPAVADAAKAAPAAADAAKAAPAAAQGKPAAPVQSADEVITGKVVETMNGGGYSYFLLEKNGMKTWVAVPPMEGKVGTEMSFKPGIEMANFKSRALDRTFERIIFSGGPVQSSGEEFLKSKAHAMGGQKAEAPAKKEAVPAGPVKVARAGGKDAYTIEELYKKKKSLDKKEVVVAGKVMKISSNIMKKNWVHLQDGTGDEKKGTHNLVVTMQESPEEGAVITVRGTAFAGKDFGAGYKYELIVEKATIVK